MGTTTPVCQSRGQPYNVQSLQELGADLINTRGSATEELFNCLSDLDPRNWRVIPLIPRLCFLLGRRVSGIKEVLEVFLPPSDNFLSRRQQRTASTIDSAGRAPLSPPETPDGLPESLRGSPKVFFHGLSELLPHPSFCFSHCLSRIPFGLSIPVSCLWSPTG
ncbi:tripartite motif-containing protein 35 [Sarotherodon galilaeus]